RDGVGVPRLDESAAVVDGHLVVGDDGTGELLLEVGQEAAGALHLADEQEGQSAVAQLAGDVPVEGGRVRVAEGVPDAVRADVHADAVGAPHAGDGVGDLQQEARPVL